MLGFTSSAQPTYVKLGQNGIVSPLIKLVGEAGQRRRSYETSVEARVFVGHDLRVVPL